MKRLITATLLLVIIFHSDSMAQEKYGRTLNLGLGIGGTYGNYAYAATPITVFNINYEFDVARNFTLAPSLSFYTIYHHYYYHGNNNYPSAYYDYRETVIPIALKGTYYFDELLKANDNWDFYLAASLGFNYVRQTWDPNYPGDREYYPVAAPLLLHLHIGAEYHFNSRVGAFLDLSTGVSTIGLAFHGLNNSNNNTGNSNNHKKSRK